MMRPRLVGIPFRWTTMTLIGVIFLSISVVLAAGLSGLTYDSVSYSVDNATSASNSVQSIFFKSDGTKMYTIGHSGFNKVYQYSLSTAWDISSASYDSVSYTVSEETATRAIHFNSDGTTLYVIGDNNDTVYQYTLSTAWDVSTATYASKSFSTRSQDGLADELRFKSDGTKMYMVGFINKIVYQYSLSSAWDVSTASYDSVSFSFSSQDTGIQGVVFNADGTILYMNGGTGDDLYQYTLSSAWDVSTMSYASQSFDYVATAGTAVLTLQIGKNDEKLYLGNLSHVHQYSLVDTTAPTATPRLPSDNATDVSTTTNLIINFNEAVRTGTGSMTIKLASDDSTIETITTSGSLLTASGTTALVFNPTTILSDSTSYYINWTANAFKDLVGNNAAALTATTTWNFTTGDSTAPNVTALSPTDNSTDVALDANLVITFDQVTRAGTGSMTIKLASNDSTVETITVSGALLSNNGTTALTFNPATTLSNSTSYYVNWTTNTFKDIAGNHTGALLTTGGWNFTTVAATATNGGRAGHDAVEDRIDSTSVGAVELVPPTLSDLGIATEVTQAALRPVGGIMSQSFRSFEAQYLNRKVREVIALLNDRLKENIDRFSAHNGIQTAVGGQMQVGDTERRLSRAGRKEEGRDVALHGASQIGERGGYLVATVLADEVVFRDVPIDSWFAPFVSTLIEGEIASGYSDAEGKPTGVFGVSSAVTRAESLKMVLMAVGTELGTLPPPRNTSAEGTWASPYVAFAEEKALSVFSPSTDVHSSATRGEVVQMILEISGILRAPDAHPQFSDVQESHPYAPAIATAAFYGLITGDDDTGNFRPDDTINRAEVSKIVALLNALVQSN